MVQRGSGFFAASAYHTRTKNVNDVDPSCSGFYESFRNPWSMDKRKKKKEGKSGVALQIKQPGSVADTGGGDDFADHAPLAHSNTSDETNTLTLEKRQHQGEIERSQAVRVAGGSSDRYESEMFVSKSFEDDGSLGSKTILADPLCLDSLHIVRGHVMKQRDNLRIIVDSVKKHTHVINVLTEAGKLGRCQRCALQAAVRSLYSTEDEVLTEAVQCTDDLAKTSSDFVKITVLLNDGKTFNRGSDFNRGDSGILSGFESSERTDDTMDARTSGAASRFSDPYQRDGLSGRGSTEENDGDTIRAADFAFDADRQISICPICAQGEFYSIDDLRMHVEGHFPERDILD